MLVLQNSFHQSCRQSRIYSYFSSNKYLIEKTDCLHYQRICLQHLLLHSFLQSYLWKLNTSLFLYSKWTPSWKRRYFVLKMRWILGRRKRLWQSLSFSKFADLWSSIFIMISVLLYEPIEFSGANQFQENINQNQ